MLGVLLCPGTIISGVPIFQGCHYYMYRYVRGALIYARASLFQGCLYFRSVITTHTCTLILGVSLCPGIIISGVPIFQGCHYYTYMYPYIRGAPMPGHHYFRGAYISGVPIFQGCHYNTVPLY